MDFHSIPAIDMTNEPKLDPPGAGLPAIERFVAAMILRFRTATGSRESLTASFRRERERIRTATACFDEPTAATRVLIKRPPGLEDSSRYWSLWMTLDHLRIVNDGMAGIIQALSQGVVPETVASTAAVKPSAEVTREVVEDYEKSCAALLATAAAVPDLKTQARFTHPWFGPLDAMRWYALAAAHLGIHRVQIQRIHAGLESSGQMTTMRNVS